MTVEAFDALLNAYMFRRPFKIFTIESHGDRRFEIDAPGSVVFRDGVARYIAPGRVFVDFDHEGVNRTIDAHSGTDLNIP